MWPSTRPRNGEASAQGLIDAHCHIDFPQFDDRREQLLAECAANGIRRIVVPGTVPDGWRKILELARTYSILAPAAGLHPWWADGSRGDSLEQLDRLLTDNSDLVAVGECGLDRKQGPALTQQQSVFEAQIRLAGRHDRPLLIHSVGTHDTVLALLRRLGFTLPFLMHGFSGSREQADALVRQGAFIGVSGIITHPRASRARRVMAQLPLESLVLETDAPGLPPHGVPRDSNTPLNLSWVLDTLCSLREEPQEEIVAAIRDNTRRLFMQRLDTEGLQKPGAPV
ncbi:MULTISPECIES: TatD family hydrolase [Halomonadaceae]|uniref:TatD family deoxyribonuclease n=1 Tax=Vreelandella halophila TaxID=86177 RepID=A0A9X4YBH4_9GAMM|nr:MULTISPECIES: TatD family hydrolase [Halomonas]MYL26679.1 TatD family deoxyribonuclease [Halomonas utahensis]MYL74016.1 TatD family deoxyribonuclease [Halomonas sp. 22501_18_FS]